MRSSIGPPESRRVAKLSWQWPRAVGALMAFLNCSVQYATGRPAIQGGIELFSSNRDIGTAMGRPRKFSREGVLQKALSPRGPDNGSGCQPRAESAVPARHPPQRAWRI